MVRLLIESGANINKRGLNNTTLSRAVDEIDEQMVTYLLQNDACDALCLPIAVEHRSKAITKQLLEHGMDVNARDGREHTALHMIAILRFRGRFDSEESHGFCSATFSLPESERAQELEEPVKIPGVRVAKSLMAFYGRVDIQDKHGVTPLMRLAGSGLGKETESWEGVRDWKVSKEDQRIIDCMIQHGARFHQRDRSGKTLLYYAAI